MAPRWISGERYRRDRPAVAVAGPRSREAPWRTDSGETSRDEDFDATTTGRAPRAFQERDGYSAMRSDTHTKAPHRTPLRVWTREEFDAVTHWLPSPAARPGSP